jgi:outer membrane murein-binding lipoprotein Lpp
MMRGFVVATCIIMGTLLAGGCATKKYVRNTTAPVQAKVDQIGEQTNRNSQSIEPNLCTRRTSRLRVGFG